MPEPVFSVFTPLPPQRAFFLSTAKIRGYGGAMGGGKSRTGCEDVFDAALDHPGIVALVARQAHTSIVETTKKTMINQVIPPEVIVAKRASGGEDYVRLWNGSTIHFIGLDDPLRWYSSEIGKVFFDEAQEIPEDTVLRIITRLRQRCSDCERNPSYDLNDQIIPCPHLPNNATFTFNPGNPGHWLQRWFIEGGEQTDSGFYKPELWMEGAVKPLGDAEFFFARATDNPHLPADYIDMLHGQKEWIRRRYLEGLWEFISGNSFFNQEALSHYQQVAQATKPFVTGVTAGDIPADIDYRIGRTKEKPKDMLRIKSGRGPLTVWKPPFREKVNDDGTRQPAHRYVIGIDSSSGRGTDYSAIEVIDVDEFEQVAEWQDRKETGLVAEEAYRLGRLYNNALIVPEITGGWGLAVDQVLKSYKYPRLYTRRVIDRLSQEWTDRTGFETSVRTRNMVLDNLETVIREREVGLYSLKAVNEMGTFVYSDRDKAEAQPGCNDDIVLALAIAVKVVSDLPRQVVQMKEERFEPTLSAAGW